MLETHKPLVDGQQLLDKRICTNSGRNEVMKFGGRMLSTNLLGVIAALALTVQAAAQESQLPGSSFGIVGQAVQSDAVLTSKSNGTLLKLNARPVLAVTLTEPIPSATSILFGAKPEVPFDTTRTLYGWPERPGLYCDFTAQPRLGAIDCMFA